MIRVSKFLLNRGSGYGFLMAMALQAETIFPGNTVNPTIPHSPRGK